MKEKIWKKFLEDNFDNIVIDPFAWNMIMKEIKKEDESNSY